MTPPSDDEPLHIACHPVAALLRARMPLLTRRVVEQLRAVLPSDRQTRALEGITRTVQQCVRMFADVLEHDRQLSTDTFREHRVSAERCAEEGIPLDVLLNAYHTTITLCCEEVIDDATSTDFTAMRDILARMRRVYRQLTSEVSSTYLATQDLLRGEEQCGEHALMSALLTGEPLDRFSVAAGPRPAPLYVVLCLAWSGNIHERGHEDSPRSGMRGLRQMRAELDRFSESPPLISLDSFGGDVLLPATAEPAWGDLCDLVARLSESANTAIVAGGSVVAPADIPAAREQNAEIVDLVLGSGRPPGLYRLDDVLLDFQLSRPSAALTRLAHLLDPLDPKPELLHTLEVYLRFGLDRRATAAAVHVHPNTVDYRMQQVARLTGLHPARPHGLQHINAALLARRTLTTPAGAGRRPYLTSHGERR